MPDAPRRYAPAATTTSTARTFGVRKAKSAAARGYDRTWREQSRIWLDRMFELYVAANPQHLALLPGYFTPSGEQRLNPPCIDCLRNGVVFGGSPSNPIVVDHVVAHKGDLAKFWNEANWQPLCARHNSAKAVREEGALGRVTA